MANIVEFPFFTLKQGVSKVDFLQAHEQFHREFVSKQTGYISHKLLVDGEKYFDMVVWETMEDKNNAFQAIYESKEAIEFIALIDDSGSDEEIPIFYVVKDYSFRKQQSS